LQGIIFDWDENKNKINVQKHGVSFDEAITVFADERALLIHDEEHSEQEERFVILGISRNTRLLVVCHCYRENDSTIRLISARKATKTESELYGGVL